jgi:hypothetical protein
LARCNRQVRWISSLSRRASRMSLEREGFGYPWRTALALSARCAAMKKV